MSDKTENKPKQKLDESLLSPLPPFAKLERRQIRQILDQATVRRYDEGSTIFAEGMPAERFYLLLDGVVRVIRVTPAGEHVTALHIPAGQLFGIASAIGKTEYPATSEAAAESIILSWPKRLWPEFSANYDGFATETYKTVGERIGEMNNRIMEMSTQHVEQRIANALLRLINQSGRKVSDGIEIGFPITRQDLSELTGTTLHTVSRLMSAWEKQGLVQSKRKKVKVLDPHKLVLFSGAEPL